MSTFPKQTVCNSENHKVTLQVQETLVYATGLAQADKIWNQMGCPNLLAGAKPPRESLEDTELSKNVICELLNDSILKGRSENVTNVSKLEAILVI